MLCNLASQIIPEWPIKLPIPGLSRREVGGAKVQRLGGQKAHGRKKCGEEGEKRRLPWVSVNYKHMAKSLL